MCLFVNAHTISRVTDITLKTFTCFLHFQVSIIMRDGNESTCIVDNAAHVKRVSLSLVPHFPSHQLSRHGGWKSAGRRHPCIPFERKAHSPPGRRFANGLSVEIIKAAEFSAEFSVLERFLSTTELTELLRIHCCLLFFTKKSSSRSRFQTE